MSNLRDERPLLTAVLLLAAGLRFVACTIWSEDLTRDPDAYRGHAERLVAGQGYVAPDGRPTAFRPPLYPLLLAGVLWAGPVGIAVLQVTLGVGTAALTAALGRRLGLGRWSVFAAGLVAADPLLLRYTPQVMTEVTCAFLAVLVLWLAAGPSQGTERPQDTPPPPAPPPGEGGARALAPDLAARPSPLARRPFLLGLALGLAVLSRPTFWAFGLLAAITGIWGRTSGKRPPAFRPVHARQAALVLFGAMLVVAPWAVRNAVALGRPVLTTTHGGYTLLLANNPVFWREVVAGPPGTVWDGGSLAAWQQSLERQMAADQAPSGEIARDRWMRDRALAHIRDQPVMFARSVVYRLMRFWSVSPAAGGGSAVLRKGAAVFYLGAYVLAGIGVARLLRRLWRPEGGSPPDLPNGAAPWRPALLLILAFTAVHAVYWTDGRMRAPLIPAVSLFAANGLAGLSAGMPGRSRRAGT